MKRLPWVLILVLIVGLTGAVIAFKRAGWDGHTQAGRAVYYCPMHPTYTSDRPGDCPICSMKLVKKEQASGPGQPQTAKDICYLHTCPMMKPGQKCPMLVVAKAGEKVTCPVCGTHIIEASKPGSKKILYWTDPMIPGYKADKPGKSPMGMDLTPVYEEEAPLAASANAPEGYAPVLVTPEKRQLIGVRTEAVAKRSIKKTIRAVGVIAHDPELYQAQQELIQAVHAWKEAQAGPSPEMAKQAQEIVDSSRLRLRHLGLSEELIDEIATWTKPDERLLIGGAGQCWVYASIYEYELPFVRPDQTAVIDVSALPGDNFSGVVKAIDPILDPMTRTTRVRILVGDPQGLLKPAMYVNVAVSVDMGEVIAVPESAVFSTGTQSVVFVDKGQGVFEPRRVSLGSKADDYYEVKEGLAEAEEVVVSGNFLIDSESRLKGALQGDGAHADGQ